jgi:DNA-directed RNA polymerase subunit K/omega
MTCVSVIAVPLEVPSTRTGSPVVIALEEIELVPFL